MSNVSSIALNVPDHPILVQIGSTPVNASVSSAPYISVPSVIDSTPDVMVNVAGISLHNASFGNTSVTLTTGVGALSALDSTGQLLCGSGTGNLVLSGALSTVQAELATLAYSATSGVGGTDAVTAHVKDADGGSYTTTVPVRIVAGAVAAVSAGTMIGGPSGVGVLQGVVTPLPRVTLANIYAATTGAPMNVTVHSNLGWLNVSSSAAAVSGGGGPLLTLRGTEPQIVDALRTLSYFSSVLGADNISIVAVDSAGVSTTQSLAVNVVAGH